MITNRKFVGPVSTQPLGCFRRRQSMPIRFSHLSLPCKQLNPNRRDDAPRLGIACAAIFDAGTVSELMWVKCIGSRANNNAVFQRGQNEEFAMPYASNSALPSRVRGRLPSSAQDIYREAFNHGRVSYSGDVRRQEIAH